MPKLIQINVTANWGSTGKIVEQIGYLAVQNRWESYIVYGRYSNPSKSQLIKIDSKMEVYEHYVENRLFDNEGLASRKATRRLVKWIKEIKPTIVHLHNLHDHYLNYPILFDGLEELGCPVVWTQHDCWAFTGGCVYNSMIGCNQWKTECIECPKRRGMLWDRTNYQYKNKRQNTQKIKNLTLVSVSEWLAGEVRQSFLRNCRIETILNGVDINIFKPIKTDIIRTKFGIGKDQFLLGVASVWEPRKGLQDYIKLASLLEDSVKIVLVGLTEKQSRNLPANIVSVPRTQNVQDLVELYSEAEIVLNLSYEETFGLTTTEGFACGTPSIVYNCTASPELIIPETGRVVEKGDIEGVYIAIKELLAKGKENMATACRARAVEKYNKDKCFELYINLYNELMENNG